MIQEKGENTLIFLEKTEIFILYFRSISKFRNEPVFLLIQKSFENFRFLSLIAIQSGLISSKN